MEEIEIDWSRDRFGAVLCPLAPHPALTRADECAGCKHWRGLRYADHSTSVWSVMRDTGERATHVRCAYVPAKPCRVCDGRTRVTACDPSGNPIPSAPIVPCPRCEGTGKEPIADGV